MRVRSRWQDKDKERSVDDTASALAFIIWRIAGNAVLNMENEGFQTQTNEQRILTILEYVALLVHVIDRLSYEQIEQQQRQEMITSLALYLAGHYQDNMTDAKGVANHKKVFLECLNERMSDYAAFGFDEQSPDFSMRRLCGEFVTKRLGPKDSKWVTAHVMDVEIPEAMDTLSKTIVNLLPELIVKNNSK